MFVGRRADGGSGEDEEEGGESNSAFQPLMSQISSGLTSVSIFSRPIAVPVFGMLN